MLGNNHSTIVPVRVEVYVIVRVEPLVIVIVGRVIVVQERRVHVMVEPFTVIVRVEQSRVCVPVILISIVLVMVEHQHQLVIATLKQNTVLVILTPPVIVR